MDGIKQSFSVLLSSTRVWRWGRSISVDKPARLSFSVFVKLNKNENKYRDGNAVYIPIENPSVKMHYKCVAHLQQEEYFKYDLLGTEEFWILIYQAFASSEVVSEHIEKVTSSRATFDAMPRVIYMYHKDPPWDCPAQLLQIISWRVADQPSGWQLSFKSGNVLLLS